MSKVILVTGATGKQGGAVIENLLGSDFTILAVSRNSSSASAQKLASKSKNIRVIQGNFDDPAGIFASAKAATSEPVWGVFSVQIVDPKNEENQGKAFVDEALKNDVKIFVYTSVDRGGERSIDNPTNVPHFITKHNIEHHLIEKSKGTKMNWTVLRPVAFLDNIQPGFAAKIFFTALKMYMNGKPLQVIDTKDIGFFAADAFQKPEAYTNKFISLAGDEVNFETASKIFEQKMGKPIPLTYEFLISLIFWFNKDFGLMFQWFAKEGYGANIAELKKIYPSFIDFERFVEERKLSF